MKLIQTRDYLLLIDEEAEIKNFYVWNDTYAFSKLMPSDKEHLDKNEVSALIASLPEIEGLPLLPPLLEDWYIATEEYKPFARSQHSNMTEVARRVQGFYDGYKVAQSHSKQFSLEDMKKAIEMAQKESWDEGGYLGLEYEPDKIIKIISTPKVPKEFIPEYEIVYEKNREFYGSGMFNKYSKKLKTITNSEGKKQLVGIYKY